MDWQSLRDGLARLRTRWDLAILVNLAESRGPVRPADLIKAINAQSGDGLISWKVLESSMRRLEAAGYVAREEVPHVPRETATGGFAAAATCWTPSPSLTTGATSKIRHNRESVLPPRRSDHQRRCRGGGQE